MFQQLMRGEHQSLQIGSKKKNISFLNGDALTR